jgi:hypothetical protein
MKTIKISGHKIKVYDSIDEMPINRYHLFNLAMLEAAGIGSTIGAINMHYNKLESYMKAGLNDSAMVEIANAFNF